MTERRLLTEDELRAFGREMKHRMRLHMRAEAAGISDPQAPRYDMYAIGLLLEVLRARGIDPAEFEKEIKE
jgi:hypothetical protein